MRVVTVTCMQRFVERGENSHRAKAADSNASFWENGRLVLLDDLFQARPWKAMLFLVLRRQIYPSVQSECGIYTLVVSDRVSILKCCLWSVWLLMCFYSLSEETCVGVQPYVFQTLIEWCSDCENHRMWLMRQYWSLDLHFWYIDCQLCFASLTHLTELTNTPFIINVGPDIILPCSLPRIILKVKYLSHHQFSGFLGMAVSWTPSRCNLTMMLWARWLSINLGHKETWVLVMLCCKA